MSLYPCIKTEPRPQFASGIIHRPRGIEIPYFVQGDDLGHRLILAHALASQSAHALRAFSTVIEAGWAVATFDQRGHAGATPIANPTLYDCNLMAVDILSVMDELGWDRAWIGGFSMGAATSFIAALDAPKRVEGLLQIAPSLHDQPYQMATILDSVASVLNRGGFGAALMLVRSLMRCMNFPRETIERVKDVRIHDAASLACALRTIPHWVVEEIPLCARDLEVPVIVLGWDGDRLHPLKLAESIATSARSGFLHVLDSKAVAKQPEIVGCAFLDLLEHSLVHS